VREGERRGQISTHTASQQQIAGRASEQRGYRRTQLKPALPLDLEAGYTIGYQQHCPA